MYFHSTTTHSFSQEPCLSKRSIPSVKNILVSSSSSGSLELSALASYSGSCVRTLLAGIQAEVSLSFSVSGTSQQKHILAGRGSLSQLVKRQAFSLICKDSLSGTVGKSKSAYSESRGHIQQSHIVSNATHDCNNLVILYGRSMLGYSGKRDGVSIESGLVESLVDDGVEAGVGSAGEEGVELDQKLEVRIGGLGFSEASIRDAAASDEIDTHVSVIIFVIRKISILIIINKIKSLLVYYSPPSFQITKKYLMQQIEPDRLSVRDIASCLSQFDLMLSYQDCELSRIARHTTLIKFKPGHIFYKQKQPADAVFFLIVGTVALYQYYNGSVPYTTASALKIQFQIDLKKALPSEAKLFQQLKGIISKKHIINDQKQLSSMIQSGCAFGLEKLEMKRDTRRYEARAGSEGLCLKVSQQVFEDIRNGVKEKIEQVVQSQFQKCMDEQIRLMQIQRRQIGIFLAQRRTKRRPKLYK